MKMRREEVRALIPEADAPLPEGEQAIANLESLDWPRITSAIE